MVITPFCDRSSIGRRGDGTEGLEISFDGIWDNFWTWQKELVYFALTIP